MRWLLDTNVIIRALKKGGVSIRRRLALYEPVEITVCSVVMGELYHGAWKYDDQPTRLNLVHLATDPFVCLPYDDHAAQQYGRIRHELELRGNLIGPNDLMIASIALTHGLTLVTGNIAEFQRVPGLLCEDWQ